ncbi:glycosyltransferase family 39 protein [bacterium SCSIO 12741]|nr:glycosyltransferase family 39 protein [bacterium SCSIO 12741]
MISSNRITIGLFWLVVFPTAAVLRFFRASEISFTLDELSVLHRTGYGSFEELIREGIWNDVHPAGIQIMMHYYTQLVGYETALVKLPFLLMGLGSVVITFYLGKRWFSPTTGLLSSALLASVQFSVMYSQIIRPYASGMFFALAAAWFFTRYVFDEKRSIGVQVGWLISTSLAMYNHYFSFMMAGIIWASALLFLRKSEWKQYILLSLALGALYLPHLPLFVKQLAYGSPGGWLPPPEDDFLWQWLNFLFHFSDVFTVCILAVIGIGILTSGKNLFQFWGRRLLSLSWFALPFLIGYLYSIWRTPMLQYSGLLFGFPFLLLAAFSLIRTEKTSYQIAFLLLVLIPSVYSLIYGREYYERFYEDGYEKPVIAWEKAKLQLKDSNVPLLYRGSTSMTHFFDLQWPNKERAPYRLIEWTDSASLYQAENFVQETGSDRIAVSAAWQPGRDWIGRLRKEYPYLLERGNYYLLDYFLLSKDFRDTLNYKNIQDTAFYESVFYPSGQGSWNIHDGCRLQEDSNFVPSVKIDSACEFALEYRIPFNDLIQHPQQVADFYLQSSSQRQNQFLVLAIVKGDSTLHYETRNLAQYLGYHNSWTVLSFEPGPALYNKSQGGELVVYFWNKAKTSVELDAFEILVRKENPYCFWLKHEF